MSECSCILDEEASVAGSAPTVVTGRELGHGRRDTEIPGDLTSSSTANQFPDL